MMTKIVEMRDPTLTAGELSVRDVEVIRQIWHDGWGYTGFVQHPRPKSGLVFICSEIEGTFSVLGGETLIARQGDVFYAPRGCRYSVSFRGGRRESRMDSYTVHFNLYDEAGEELLFSNRPVILTNDPACRFSAGAEALWRAVNRAELSANRFKVSTKFFSLLDEVIDEVRVRDAGLYPIRAGVEALCNEWDQNEHMSRYAELCGVCESYFYLLFKNWAGMSPVEYRNRIRMTSAATLLCNTDLTVREIAATVGFDDPFYFSRAFRRTFGIPPLQYRKGGGKDERALPPGAT
ncbi:MAG: helix-turn-helix domain-containing protein [Clostridia bacterium]|nr:helix-turn-helix domain-containing protein [Clostridia bacterium]